MGVIGNGLIANAFKKNGPLDEVIILAAGVSNSQNIDMFEFEREKKLVDEVISKADGKKIIYFSSCSIFQKKKTPYIKHKLEVENILIESKIDVAIFRLPQVVGLTNNNTIVSYFTRNIFLNNDIEIEKNAYRYLIDVDDIVRIVNRSIGSLDFKYNEVCNLTSANSISAFEIAIKIREILGSNSNIKIIDGGESYKLEASWIKKYMGDNDIILAEEYPVQVLEKYVHLIKNKYLKDWTKD